MNLTHYLSSCGAASRRRSAELIKAGNVKVNGAPVAEPGFKVNEKDIVTLNGTELRIGKRYYIMLNKPRGYICTSDDPYAPKKAIDLIGLENVRLFSVGRLDKESEGMLIFTNDGDYAAKLTGPGYGIEKIYIAGTDKPLSAEMIEALQRGIEDEGEKLFAAAIEELAPRKYRFTMKEGKKREIRRLLKYASTRTVYLKRIATGKLSIGDLSTGKWRYLSDEDIRLSLDNN
ncbi:MAG: hypothetical protein A2017_20185 [Lentisphaerae bacterium GWF2_44_16]|nr:MAG: hypothetical protein A2017_20185 [Lentisphaerae bacterium GWF2_44_16]